MPRKLVFNFILTNLKIANRLGISIYHKFAIGSAVNISLYPNLKCSRLTITRTYIAYHKRITIGCQKYSTIILGEDKVANLPIAAIDFENLCLVPHVPHDKGVVFGRGREFLSVAAQSDFEHMALVADVLVQGFFGGDVPQDDRTVEGA